ncbi:hypothetical protein BDZ88DRAFT_436035 [Geranomyces variabilis]|nr:hypothetical protein BDZ88DRAFT_436035 [Geranomyces variabilis]
MAATDNYEMAVDLDAGVDEMQVDEGSFWLFPPPNTGFFASKVPDHIDNVKANATKKKGRGFQERRGEGEGEGTFGNARFESLEDGQSVGQAQRSVEGWIILITGVNEEATEEEVTERCAEYGEIKNIHLNLDRRTGYVKGYALVEYETNKEALDAVQGLDNTTFLEQTIHASFAFVRGASKSKSVQERTARHPRNDDRRGR